MATGDPERRGLLSVDESSARRSRHGISVVVPAHNEGQALAATLQSCLQGTDEQLELVVVSNGSSDDTAEVARRFAAEHDVPVTVIELRQASKTLALRHGLAVATGEVVVVTDADLLIDPGTFALLAGSLSSTIARLATPQMQMDTSRSSAAVRAYYRVWTRLPFAARATGGVFALNRAGVARV